MAKNRVKLTLRTWMWPTPVSLKTSPPFGSEITEGPGDLQRATLHCKQNPASQEFKTKMSKMLCTWQKQASHQAMPKVMPSCVPCFLRQRWYQLLISSLATEGAKAFLCLSTPKNTAHDIKMLPILQPMLCLKPTAACATNCPNTTENASLLPITG